MSGMDDALAGDPRYRKMFAQTPDPYSPMFQTDPYQAGHQALQAQLPTAEFDDQPPMQVNMGGGWNTAKQPATGGVKTPPMGVQAGGHGGPEMGGPGGFMSTQKKGLAGLLQAELGGYKQMGQNVLGGIKAIGA